MTEPTATQATTTTKATPTAPTTMVPIATTTATTSRRRAPSARRRILGWYVLLLGAALVAALLLQRALLLSQVIVEVDVAIDQEVGELRSLAAGNNPSTGQPFGGDAAAIFETLLARNVGIEGEAIVTLVNGQLFKSDLAGAVLAQTSLVEEWAAVTTSTRREVDVDQSRIRYLAVPLLYEDRQVGTFVSAVDVGPRLARVERVVRLGALVYGSVFLVASALAWVAAGGVLRPLRDLTNTARTITESDLSQRIPMEGDDEVAELGRTFNAMLDRLEEAFSVQRRFVDDAGHELRTPITVIRGNLELMADHPVEREQTLRLVTDELDRMARIVDDLLVLAKAEQPDFIQPHPIDVAEFTQELLDKGAVLDGRVWHLDQRAHVVMVGDRHRLTQAMMNLMRNAVEHSGTYTRVAIGSRAFNGHVSFWVRDEGSGIAPEDKDRLFDRFARGRVGKRATGGAGLGLAIVKTIAEAHGGWVELESNLGEGSRFTLVVPVGDEVDQ